MRPCVRFDVGNLHDERHETVISLFINDPTYYALHIAVARLFTEQLKKDLVLLSWHRHQGELLDI